MLKDLDLHKTIYSLQGAINDIQCSRRDKYTVVHKKRVTFIFTIGLTVANVDQFS